jgi:carbon-monoxide dehydrogenase medium subunit
MLQPFRLHSPATLDAASALLIDLGDEAAVYAGGTELLLVMKAGLRQYQELVDVKTIRGLRFVEWRSESRTLVIGAATTHREIERSPVVGRHMPILAEMERSVANVRIRTQGTIGGNLCFAEPHSDPATLLLVLDATVSLFGHRSGPRVLPLQDFILDAYTTGLAPGEVMTSIEIPALPSGGGVAYRKFALHERPTLGVAAAVVVAPDGSVTDARIAIGCVGPKPARMAEAEAELRHMHVSRPAPALSKAAAAAAAAIDAIDDLHGSAKYKRHLVEVFVRRAVEEAVARAAAGGTPQ